MMKNGVLPDHLLKKLITGSNIAADIDIQDQQIQPASLDLRIGRKCFRIRSSFLPQGSTVEKKMGDLLMYEIDLLEGGILEKGNVYIIPLIERLNLPPNLRGRSNPKSSTGRLDIFTRIITDYSYRFEDIQSGYNGKLYLEIVPKSFTIRVTAGQSLNQLRIFNRDEKSITYDSEHNEKISDKALFDYHRKTPLLFTEEGKPINNDKIIINDGLFMGINLHANNQNIIGYKAKKNSAIIDLNNINHYKIQDYWEPIYSSQDDYLILEPEEFYILASKERVRIPIEMAGEMVEFDAGSGELRTHYAGFFDSGFGFGYKGELLGTKAVLEVRPHDVPFRIEDGQIFCKIRYERMVDRPSTYYGGNIGSHYHDQGLALSKHFK